MIVKMLRGTKAEDIPLKQPASFEMVINVKTAKAGHELSAGLVLRAGKLVE